MAAFTVDELKDYSGVSAVTGWSDNKILIYQTTAETLVDAASTGTDAYKAAVLLVFNFVAQNSTGLRSLSKGRLSYSFGDLPDFIQNAIMSARAASNSSSTTSFSPAVLQRQDIGRR
jgi:hypothetical protein